MATTAQWVAGARLRTLPVAVAPVLAGSGAAAGLDGFVAWKAAICLAVALLLQIGVNYANDYSDGVRGTDADRVGPLRLVGSGTAPAAQVKAAAFTAFGLASVGGVVLAATTAWWLLAMGAAAIAAAWFYTGGSHPYGYRALGEVSVFCFFGLAAVLGTTYVQARTVGRDALLAAVGCGALACAVLVANNLRDIPTDRVTGKRTLSVVIGDPASRRLYVALVAVALLLPIAMTTWWALLAWASLPLVVRAARPVVHAGVGPALIAALKYTGLAELVFGLGLAVGLAIG